MVISILNNLVIWNKKRIVGLSLTIGIFIFGGLVNLQAQIFSLQIANISSATPIVDLYVNGDLFADDLFTGTSTPYFEISPSLNTRVVIAPSGSASVSDSLFSIVFNSTLADNHAVIVYDDQAQLKMKVYSGLRRNSTDTTQIDIAFINHAPTAPGLNVVVREGNMVASNLEFGDISAYNSYDSDDHYFDLKAFGTNDILATYRVSTQGSEGDAMFILITGDISAPYLIQLWAIKPEGLVQPVDYAPLARVQYINTLADTIDVFKNGNRFVDNAVIGAAMPFKNIPAEIPISIGITPFINSSISFPLPPYATFDYQFVNAQKYIVVTAGRIGSTTFPLSMFFAEEAREIAADTNLVEVRFFNGDYVHPALTLANGQVPVVNAVAYGTFSSYVAVSPSVYEIKVNDSATGALIFGPCTIDLSGYRGQALNLYTLVNADSTAALWLAEANGHSIQLCQSVGLSKPMEFESLVISPNPATDEIRISGSFGAEKQMQIDLLSAMGTVVYKTAFSVYSEQEVVTTIPVGAQPAGLYFLRLTNPNGQVFTKKIQINR